eukprot:scaffold299899_cov19-Tisochrysis_lutea.AAC.2
MYVTPRQACKKGVLLAGLLPLKSSAASMMSEQGPVKLNTSQILLRKAAFKLGGAYAPRYETATSATHGEFCRGHDETL